MREEIVDVQGSRMNLYKSNSCPGFVLRATRKGGHAEFEASRVVVHGEEGTSTDSGYTYCLEVHLPREDSDSAPSMTAWRRTSPEVKVLIERFDLTGREAGVLSDFADGRNDLQHFKVAAGIFASRLAESLQPAIHGPAGDATIGRSMSLVLALPDMISLRDGVMANVNPIPVNKGLRG